MCWRRSPGIPGEARPALGEDLAGGDIQGGEEGGCAMADIAVRDPLDVAQSEE